MKIITGSTGQDHITANDDGALHASVFGEGCYVLAASGRFTCTVVDNTTVQIGPGEGLMYGRHFRTPRGSVDTLSIGVGASGYNRNDIIAAHYKNNGGVESIGLVVIPGNSTTGVAADPSFVQDDISAGATDSYMPLYRIRLSGINIDGVDTLYTLRNFLAQEGHKHSASDIDDGLIRIKNGGTGANNGSDACDNIGAVKKSGDTMTGRLDIPPDGLYVKKRSGSDTSDGGHIIFESGDAENNAGVFAGAYRGGFRAYATKDGIHSIELRPDGTFRIEKLEIVDAAGARVNLGVTPDNIGALPASGGKMTGFAEIDKGNYAGMRWYCENGSRFDLRAIGPNNVFQLTVTPKDGSEFGAINIDTDGNPTLAKPLPVPSGGTGANSKKAARKNLGVEIQVGVENSVGSSERKITFSDAFSGVPVVTANGENQTSIRVYDVTETGFTMVSGTSGNTVQWQAIYISD